jgi:hypothetical protein
LEEKMKRHVSILCLILGALITAAAAGAGDFDGSRPLLISVSRVIECTPDGDCREVSLASTDLPQFLKVDFANKTVRSARAETERPGTAIERQETVDGKLILQGAEDGYEKMRDGLGWTIAVSQETGRVVLTASGEEVAFVVFGAALPL